MKAAEVLAALRVHHSDAALVQEVSIGDLISDHQATFDAGDLPVYRRRIDALMFHKLQRTAIEIKVTRADAASETWRKVAPWKAVCHRFVYAVPAGLIEKPPTFDCGLWWVHPDGRVEVRVKAKVNPYPEHLPQSVIQNLAQRAAGQAVGT